ncbi:MAG TPA: Rieske 2Fe-2S domain-containing protein [Candidatus Binataceae bacterium]|nr:Rieske 2Fe-2S domain-containing protein [Candidatus Binataceae bacterium]
MLTQADNQLVTQVGAGRPMGEMLREYWMPAVLASKLEADGAPARVRLLGENFIAFRATDGRVGFFDEGCPHRCTSLALARNEDNALTCIFHGWKIDVSGKVVEVPSEPPERRAEFAAKVRVRHYPVREAGGAIWVYLGRREQPPNFPRFEFNLLPPSHIDVYRGILHSNWFQVMETTIDSSHLGVLHSYWLRTGREAAGTPLAAANNGPTYEVLGQPWGFREAALRDLFDGTVYTRIREVVAPFYSFVPMDSSVSNLTLAPVPIDDEWTSIWYWRFDLHKPLTPEELFQIRGYSHDPDNVASGLGGIDNRWGQDRKAMKEGHWSGLRSLNIEDFAVAEAPGAIADRSREYLGSSDSTLIRYRRMMLAAVRAHMAGQPALGQEQEIDYSKIRAVTLRNPKGYDWRQCDPLAPPASMIV